MTIKKPLLLIPVENQVRELDPKLLMACVAAERFLLDNRIPPRNGI
jgi:hypothetical protein